MSPLSPSSSHTSMFRSICRVHILRQLPWVMQERIICPRVEHWRTSPESSGELWLARRSDLHELLLVETWWIDSKCLFFTPQLQRLLIPGLMSSIVVQQLLTCTTFEYCRSLEICSRLLYWEMERLDRARIFQSANFLAFDFMFLLQLIMK